MSDIKTGLQLYSVRKSYMENMAETLKSVKKMGYDCVEGFWLLPCRAKAYKKMLDDAGLTVCGWHTGLDKLEGDNIYSTMDYMDTIGNRYLGLNTSPDMIDTAEKVCALRDRMLKASETLAANGFYLEYHNHWWEFNGALGERPYDLLADNNNLLLQVDVGNAKNGGIDAIDYLRRHAGRHHTIHVKPYSLKDNFETTIGEDDIDWKTIFDHCDKNNVKYYIIEYEGADESNQMQRAQNNITGLNKILGR